MKKTIILGIAIASIASTALGNISVNGLSFNAGNSALGQIFFDTVGGTVANNTVKFDVIFGASSGSLTDSSPTTYTIGSTDQGFMNAGTINVTTGSLGGGSAGFYQVRAWTGGTTFADVANTKKGTSAITAITFGGTPLAGGTAIAPPDLNLHASFAITSVAVPEPATIALGLFGAAGMLILRRK